MLSLSLSLIHCILKVNDNVYWTFHTNWCSDSVLTRNWDQFIFFVSKWIQFETGGYLDIHSGQIRIRNTNISIATFFFSTISDNCPSSTRLMNTWSMMYSKRTMVITFMKHKQISYNVLKITCYFCQVTITVVEAQSLFKL